MDPATPLRACPEQSAGTGLGAAAGRLGDAREDLEQRALARAVATDACPVPRGCFAKPGRRNTCTAPHLPWRAVPGNAVRCKCADDHPLLHPSAPLRACPEQREGAGLEGDVLERPEIRIFLPRVTRIRRIIFSGNSCNSWQGTHQRVTQACPEPSRRSVVALLARTDSLPQTTGQGRACSVLRRCSGCSGRRGWRCWTWR